MERAFQEGDVAEGAQEPPCHRVTLETAASMGEQDERKVGPFGLAAEPVGQRMKIRRHQCFFGDQSEAGADRHFADELVDVAADRILDPGFDQHRRGHLGIPSLWRKDECAFGYVGQAGSGSSKVWVSPTMVGTPRRTP